MAAGDDATLSGGAMLLVSLAVTVLMQRSFFVVAFLCQFGKVTDLAGTLNFPTLAVLCLVVRDLYATRAIVVTTLVGVWALRLGSHLLLRVIKRGKDERFDEMRANCLSFFGFWVFQIVWVFVVSLPVILVNSSDAFQQDDKASNHAFAQPQDIVGIVIWGIGSLVEWAADASKEKFYEDKSNKGKLLRTNVWRYSRHPNYFGEILCWIGITIIASVTFTGSQQWFYVSVLSPILTFVLLMFVSGIPMAEERYDARFGLQPFYLEYKKSTSPLICLPPALYRRIPASPHPSSASCYSSSTCTRANCERCKRSSRPTTARRRITPSHDVASNESTALSIIQKTVVAHIRRQRSYLNASSPLHSANILKSLDIDGRHVLSVLGAVLVRRHVALRWLQQQPTRQRRLADIDAAAMPGDRRSSDAHVRPFVEDAEPAVSPKKRSRLSRSFGRRSSDGEKYRVMIQRFQLRQMTDEHALQTSAGRFEHRRSSLITMSLLDRTSYPALAHWWRKLLQASKAGVLAALARLKTPIAPNGKFQQLREIALLFVFAVQIVYFPYARVFGELHTSASSLRHWSIAFEIIFLADLLLAFNTAFYSKHGTELVVSRSEIARRYWRSWFLPDLLAAIPLDLLSCVADCDGSGGSSSGSFVLALAVRISKLVHELSLEPVFAAARALHGTRRFWMWIQYSRYSHLLQIFKLVVGVLATAHYMACTWELLDDRKRESGSQLEAYVGKLYLAMLMLQGEADANLQTTAQQLYGIGAIMLGSVVLATVFGNVAVLVSNFYTNATNYQRKMESVFDTMNKMWLPHELRDRIHQYYEHIWREYECLDGDIGGFSKRLTRSLELEVALFKYLELVTSIPFWSECSSDFITHIVLHLDVRMYLPDGYVIRKGETGTQLFMINRGKCDLVQFVKARSSNTESGGGGATGTPASNSSTHRDGSSDSDDDDVDDKNPPGDEGGEREQTWYRFRQGESFGELALLMNYRRTGSVRAVSYVEMCILNRESFQKLLFKSPRDHRKVLVAILRASIKSNMLKDIQYPWKSLVTSYARPSSAAPVADGAAAAIRARKASRANRCVVILGDDWTVDDAAAALADKIDVEHKDDSIVFGFQLADLRLLVSSKTRDASVRKRRRSASGRDSQATASGKLLAPPSPSRDLTTFCSSTPKTQSTAPQETTSRHETSESAQEKPPLASRRQSTRRRRTASIPDVTALLARGAAPTRRVLDLQQQLERLALCVASVETRQGHVAASLSALTLSIAQLDALTTERDASPRPVGTLSPAKSPLNSRRRLLRRERRSRTSAATDALAWRYGADRSW